MNNKLVTKIIHFFIASNYLTYETFSELLTFVKGNRFTVYMSTGPNLPKSHESLNNKKLCFFVFNTLQQKHCQRNHSCMNEYLIKAH